MDVHLLLFEPPASTGPEFPPHGSPPALHLAWCEQFTLYCTRQVQVARRYDLPMSKWLRAAELATFAASIWRERAAQESAS
jgi:hypothetical protein